jgi:hypothetical protein
MSLLIIALIERISIARYARCRLCRNDKSLKGYPAEKIKYRTKKFAQVFDLWKWRKIIILEVGTQIYFSLHFSQKYQELEKFKINHRYHFSVFYLFSGPTCRMFSILKTSPFSIFIR